MWNPLFCLCACVLLCRGVKIDYYENLLNEYAETLNNEFDMYKVCDHESGDPARCVKKSSCETDIKRGVTEVPLQQTTKRLILRSSGSKKCPVFHTCCPEHKIIKTISQPKEKDTKPQGCGYSNPGGVLLRGLADDYGQAEYGEFPWVVALLKTKNSIENFHKDYIGGGTIIHPSVVITAAHKVDQVNKDEITCRAGEWNSEEEELNKPQERDVTHIVFHNDLLRDDAINDVALLVLKSPFLLAAHVGVACLEPRPPAQGTRCFGTGWGRDHVHGVNNTSVMKKITLPIVDGGKCQTIYQTNGLGRAYRLHKSLICAGGKGDADTCMGDGGAPLMCPINDSNGVRYSVVGMVAYGLDCGENDIPGVYVKIPQMYDWIVREMAKLGYNKTFEY